MYTSSIMNLWVYLFYFYGLQEQSAKPYTEPPQKDKNKKVQAVLVDSWRPSNNNSHEGQSNPGHLQHLSLTYNQVDKYPDGHSRHLPHCKLHEFGENSHVVSPTFRSRLESDPIDRGVMPADSLHGKVEALENALDQIYLRMKTDLRDVRDSVKVLSRHSMDSSSSTSPLPPTKNNMYHFRYPRSKDHIDVWPKREKKKIQVQRRE